MKQRIRAEAHGSSPSGRHRPPADEDATADPDAAGDAHTPAEADTETVTPLQH